MYFSCSIVNFFLHAMTCKYLVNLSIIVSIKLYLFSIARFVDLSNLIIKFIVTLFHNDLNNF